jgi:hypothetical protein
MLGDRRVFGHTRLVLRADGQSGYVLAAPLELPVCHSVLEFVVACTLGLHRLLRYRERWVRGGGMGDKQVGRGLVVMRDGEG